MTWKETCIMKERMRFVLACEDGFAAFSDICRQFGVSRKTGYKWLARFRREGVPGLTDRSRAPKHCPHALSAEVCGALRQVRLRHPSWGPRKVKAWLEARHPDQVWPAASTIGCFFDRSGLTVARKYRHRTPPYTRPFGKVRRPNDTWCADFKGWFMTKDRKKVDPFTLTDAFSRYLIRCEAVVRPNEVCVWPLVKGALREHGLPYYFRTDNGPPFATKAAGGLSRLAVKLIKAGIQPERIEPGKPQQNGRHERMHLTLKQDTAMPPADTWRAQQQRFRAFRRIFNEERPHEALGMATPASVYRPSARDYTGLHEPGYQNDALVRRVRSNGEIKWQGNLIFISEALIGEPVALSQIEENSWQLHYSTILLGAIKGEEGFRKTGKQTATKPRNY